MAIAKTYRSDNIGQWKCPRGLSNFGMQIGANIPPLGLEEFNFTSPYLEEKIAFVPSYGQRLYDDIVDLCLFHSYNQGEHEAAIGNYVYAKLRGVRQVTAHEVEGLRHIIADRLHEVVGIGNLWANNTPLHPQFGQAQREGYLEALAMNEILGVGNNGRFVVNIHYDAIEFINFPSVANDPIGEQTEYNGRMAGVRGNMQCL